MKFKKDDYVKYSKAGSRQHLKDKYGVVASEVMSNGSYSVAFFNDPERKSQYVKVFVGEDFLYHDEKPDLMVRIDSRIATLQDEIEKLEKAKKALKGVDLSVLSL